MFQPVFSFFLSLSFSINFIINPLFHFASLSVGDVESNGGGWEIDQVRCEREKGGKRECKGVDHTTDHNESRGVESCGGGSVPDSLSLFPSLC